MKTDNPKSPEWIYRGKSIRGLIQELQTFEDLDLEVQISIDDGNTRKPISLVVRSDGQCLLKFCGDWTPLVDETMNALGPLTRPQGISAVVVENIKTGKLVDFKLRDWMWSTKRPLQVIEGWNSEQIEDEWLFAKFREQTVCVMSAAEAFEAIDETVDLLLCEQDESTATEILQSNHWIGSAESDNRVAEFVAEE